MIGDMELEYLKIIDKHLNDTYNILASSDEFISMEVIIKLQDIQCTGYYSFFYNSNKNSIEKIEKNSFTNEKIDVLLNKKYLIKKNEDTFELLFPLTLKAKLAKGIVIFNLSHINKNIKDTSKKYLQISQLLDLNLVKNIKEANLLKKHTEYLLTSHTLNLVTEISEIIVSTNSINDISRKLYIEMKKNFGEAAIGIALNSETEKRLKNCFYYEFDEKLEFNDILYYEVDRSYLLDAVKGNKEIILNNFSDKKSPAIIGRVPKACYFAPLVMNNQVIGAFTYQSFVRNTFTQVELELCKRLLPFLTITFNTNIQNEKLRRSNCLLRRKSSFDQLTGFYNRDSFYEKFSKFYLNGYKEKPLHLILFDLDNFKGVNDNFGHTYGDDALKAVSEVIKDKFEGRGILGRYGGDEFLGAIVGLDNKEIICIIDEIKKEVSDLNITYNKDNF